MTRKPRIMENEVWLKLDKHTFNHPRTGRTYRKERINALPQIVRQTGRGNYWRISRNYLILSLKP